MKKIAYFVLLSMIAGCASQPGNNNSSDASTTPMRDSTSFSEASVESLVESCRMTCGPVTTPCATACVAQCETIIPGCESQARQFVGCFTTQSVACSGASFTPPTACVADYNALSVCIANSRIPDGGLPFGDSGLPSQDAAMINDSGSGVVPCQGYCRAQSGHCSDPTYDECLQSCTGAYRALPERCQPIVETFYNCAAGADWQCGGGPGTYPLGCDAQFQAVVSCSM